MMPWQRPHGSWHLDFWKKCSCFGFPWNLGLFWWYLDSLATKFYIILNYFLQFWWQFSSKIRYTVDSFTANFQSKWQGLLTVWLQTFNQSFVPPWQFWKKVSVPFLNFKLKIKLHCKFVRNFHETFNEKCQWSMKVWLQTFNQSGNVHWQFDCKLSTKVSGWYESLTANFHKNCQRMKKT
jgi:hypothetical protein